MSASRTDLVVQALQQRGQLPQLTALQWDLLVRQARSAGLLARLAWHFELYGLTSQIPIGPAVHFQAASCVALAQRSEVEREVRHIQRALQALAVPIILLKGAAYLKARLPAAHGRLFSDTDILVPKHRLADVENALVLNGWVTTHHSAYDQRYYREWMHELPPMVHLRRQTAIDVHHAISPETARIRPSSAKLLSAAVPLPASDNLWVLAPPDMVLHSMLHLLVNDDLSHGLRDLSDLDLLLRHFGAEPGFWDQLGNRALELGLGRVLWYGLQCVMHTLATPVPGATLQAVSQTAPGPVLSSLMRSLFAATHCSPHASTATPWSSVALGLLYLRAHWLRMPSMMLARHLLVKAVRRTSDDQHAT